MQDRLTSFFWSGDAIRSRSVGSAVMTATLDVPAPPVRLTIDWAREIAEQLALAPGDVEPLPLARARTRWPDYRSCVQAMADWTGTLGLQGLLAASDIALMACRGARYHHDGAQYGSAAFCNLFLSEDKGLDVHFPVTGQRIPLVRGTAMVFDTGLPHAVVRRGTRGFDAADFPVAEACTQVFLTWELPIEDTRLATLLGVAFDTHPSTALQLAQEQVWVNDAPASVCPATGRWQVPDTLDGG